MPSVCTMAQWWYNLCFLHSVPNNSQNLLCFKTLQWIKLMISEIINFKNSLLCGDKLFRTQHPCAQVVLPHSKTSPLLIHLSFYSTATKYWDFFQTLHCKSLLFSSLFRSLTNSICPRVPCLTPPPFIH